MENNTNKSLFWYGFFAKIKKAFGVMLMGTGLIIGFIGLASKSAIGILGLGLLIFGIILIAKGSSQRFDYQRQSGYIVHGGD